MSTVQKIIQILIYVLLLAVLLVFAMGNNEQTVSVKFLGWQTVQMPVWMLVMLTLIIGLVLGLVLTTGLVLKANGEKRAVQKEFKKVKAELNRMRNVPVEEETDTETETVQES
jgi:uncharacterized integral membrane protein